MSALKRWGITGHCRKLRNEKRRDLNFSPNIIRVIKLGRMRWAGHVGRVQGVREMHAGFCKYNMHVKDYSEDQDVDGIIVLT